MLRALLTFLGMLIILSFIGVGGLIYVFNKFGQDMPDYRQLADYEPPVMTRVHAGDGRLLAEYAIEKRVFVPIRAMPRRVVNAFLSAEDKNFYSHQGVDLIGVVRAVITNVKNLGKAPHGRGIDHYPAGREEFSSDQRGLVETQSQGGDPRLQD
jgi:penicillin-binding protein 1A